MNRARILQVITRSDWGGAPRVVASLATEMDAETEVACGPGGRLIEDLRAADVPVHIQPHLQSTPGACDLLAFADLWQLIRVNDYDLVHCHSTKAGVLGRVAATLNDIPTIFTVHGWGFYNTSYDHLEPLLVRAERRLAHMTDHVVCVSHNDRREGRARNILAPDEGTVIHNGIRPLDDRTTDADIRAVFDIPTDHMIIGAITRLAPQKDPLAILRTAAALRNRDHAVSTVLIGKGPLMNECRSFVNDRDLENVYLAGFREDALSLLPEFDVFLLPSRFEGFPLTVLECLHAGVPVVAYDVGGVAEAIDSGVVGEIVPAGEEERFVEAVAALVSDPDRLATYARRARLVGSQHFTVNKMIKKYNKIYNKTINIEN